MQGGTGAEKAGWCDAVKQNQEKTLQWNFFSDWFTNEQRRSNMSEETGPDPRDNIGTALQH
jgi:hypothetical protein